MNATHPQPTPPQKERHKQALRLVLVITLGLLIDLGSKTAALHYHQDIQGIFGRDQPIALLDAGFASLSLVRQFNSGMIFGYLSDTSASLWLLISIRAAFLIWLIWFVTKTSARTSSQHLAIGILIAGALGNLSDNLFTYHPSAPHAIRDFILITFSGWSTPAFNIADVWITIGGAWYLLTLRGPDET